MSMPNRFVNGRSFRCTRRAAFGFTLIEILVVVAIIALLISILLPSLAAAREVTRRTICGTQLAEMTKSFLMYNNEHKDSLPGPLHQAMELETVDKVAAADYEEFHLPWYIRKYFSDRSRDKKLTDNIVKCPTSEKVTGVKNTWGKSDAQRPFTYVLNNWSKQMGPTAHPDNLVTSYWGTDPAQYFGWPGPGSGTNQFWASGPDVNGRFYLNQSAGEEARPKRITRIRQLGREWAIADAFCYRKDNQPPIAGTSLKDGQWRVGTYQNVGWIEKYAIPLPRRPYHDKGINLAMFDGHVEYQRTWRGTVNRGR